MLTARNIQKSFPGVRALNGVDFDLRSGEIHALLGENGAGKSTFVKILTGAHTSDGGEITIDGEVRRILSPTDAHAAGIRIVFQEFSQVDCLTVAENIFLGEWPTDRKFVSWTKMNEAAGALLAQFHVKAEATDPIEHLSVGVRQMIEILKAARQPNIKVLILDEPTSALTETETETLFSFLNRLKASGVSIIYISHRLGEISRLCDRITVFRNGENVKTCEVINTSVSDIVSLMVGRELAERFPPKPDSQQDKGLRVSNLSNSKLKGISFEARRGEILGLAGLIGAGKSEVLHALFKADHASSTTTLDGVSLPANNPAGAVRNGFALLPENRKEQGLVLTSNNTVNASLASLRQLAHPFLSLSTESSWAHQFMSKVDVRPLNPEQMVINLSGGNQQKVILARWLMSQAEVFLFDEPTRGIDVGARYQIYSLIGELANSGCCIIVASSDVEELAGVCNRVLVLARGKIVSQFAGNDVNEEKILHACTMQ